MLIGACDGLGAAGSAAVSSTEVAVATSLLELTASLLLLSVTRKVWTGIVDGAAELCGCSADMLLLVGAAVDAELLVDLGSFVYTRVIAMISSRGYCFIEQQTVNRFRAWTLYRGGAMLNVSWQVCCTMYTPV